MCKGWSITTLTVVICILTGCATSAHRYDGPYSLTQDRTVRTGAVRSKIQSHSISSRVRVPSSVSSGKSSSNSCSYVVQKGDTMYSLAFASNMELSDFASLNRIQKPYNLYVGQRLNMGNCRSNNGATSSASQPSGSSPGTTYKKRYHIVKRGETLYRISKNHGVSVATLKRLNGLKNNQIEVGQHILLGTVATSSLKTNTQIANNKQEVSSAPSLRTNSYKVATTSAKPSSSKATAKAKVSRKAGNLAWQWPTSKGRVIQNFSTGEHGNKGIDISDKRGSPVRSAAGGKVVYAGNALRGYGNLIIINHNDDYLSAYAHNDSILVSEGTEVKAGQTIAKMGDTEASSVRLHFEIRYKGQSVNPMNYLPAR